MAETHCIPEGYITRAFIEWRDQQGRPLSMMEIETLREAERKVKTHKEYVQRLEAVAKAARELLSNLKCERWYFVTYEQQVNNLREVLAALEGGDPA